MRVGSGVSVRGAGRGLEGIGRVDMGVDVGMWMIVCVWVSDGVGSCGGCSWCGVVWMRVGGDLCGGVGGGCWGGYWWKLSNSGMQTE